MKAVILQSNYIPWKGYFHLIHEADVFIFYDEVKYTKNDWRNRNKIYTPNGMQWLSIPIESTAVKLKINKVDIISQRWQEHHYKSLYYGYKRAPFFSQLEKILKEVYIESRWNNLSELNQHLIKKISSLIGIQTKFLDSENFNLEGNRVERLINLLKDAGASEYISGPSAKEYLSGSENLFSEVGIQLTYMQYPSYPVYPQLYEPFRHDVSIYDLVANIKLEEINRYIWG